MVEAINLKKGMIFEMNGKLIKVLEANHHKPGKGNTVMQMKLNDVRTGAIVQTTMRPSEKVELAIVDKKNAQYLYGEGDLEVFMDMDTYEQYELTKEQLRDDMPDFRAGDTVRVHVRVVEGTHERIQMFEGVVIKRKGAGISATYTVRKMSSGIGVERTFPVNDPRVAKVEVLRHGRVRRAKLYYLRDRHGKAARIAEKRRG